MSWIEHPAATDNFAQETVAPTQPLFENVRGPHEQVEWEAAVNGLCDANCLAELIACRHDYQQIDIAVRGRYAIGIRAK
jgi:hypothetical protein